MTTVRVRVPVAVNPEGDWVITGSYRGRDEEFAALEVRGGLSGGNVVWIEADVPVQIPVVEARVA